MEYQISIETHDLKVKYAFQAFDALDKYNKKRGFLTGECLYMT